MTAQGEDILAWLTDAITERETVARGALSFGDGFVGSDTCVYGTGDGGPYLQVVVPGFEGQAEAATNHFALYGPALVLRRCAADRKLLALHQPQQDSSPFPDSIQCRTCSEHGGDGYQYLVPAPCPTILALAEGYGWTGGER
ncbi:DUF6221 family protein [Streptomyces griseofuscus]|uniref:DUF6221 family protein n=1 Tax=Streptomyces griseofuscus TaxID=146922 RepID=UPI003691C79F